MARWHVAHYSGKEFTRNARESGKVATRRKAVARTVRSRYLKWFMRPFAPFVRVFVFLNVCRDWGDCCVKKNISRRRSLSGADFRDFATHTCTGGMLCERTSFIMIERLFADESPAVSPATESSRDPRLDGVIEELGDLPSI